MPFLRLASVYREPRPTALSPHWLNAVASDGMLDHVFTDAISALRDAFESAFLERQAFEEHFQSDVLSGDLTWETSYGLPGEGEPPRVAAHITFEWPAWSQAAYRHWYLEEILERRPAIEIEIVLRVQQLTEPADPEVIYSTIPAMSPLIGDDRLERAGMTAEVAHPDPADDPPNLWRGKVRTCHRDHLRGPVRTCRSDRG